MSPQEGPKSAKNAATLAKKAPNIGLGRRKWPSSGRSLADELQSALWSKVASPGPGAQILTGQRVGRHRPDGKSPSHCRHGTRPICSRNSPPSEPRVEVDRVPRKLPRAEGQSRVGHVWEASSLPQQGEWDRDGSEARGVAGNSASSGLHRAREVPRRRGAGLVLPAPGPAHEKLALAARAMCAPGKPPSRKSQQAGAPEALNARPTPSSMGPARVGGGVARWSKIGARLRNSGSSDTYRARRIACLLLRGAQQ